MVDERVSFRAHLERFPLAVKGALVLRGADGQPHQVVFERARMAEMSGARSLPIGLDGVVQDVGPTRDLFVPFELPSSDLTSGWYRLECSVSIDGTGSRVHPGEPFCEPWPRASTRRGTVEVGTGVTVGRGKARIDRVAFHADRVDVAYEATDDISMRVTAGARTLAVVARVHDRETGRGTVSTYPVLRGEDRLSIDVRGAPDRIEIALP